jgi:hypothetical protein
MGPRYQRAALFVAVALLTTAARLSAQSPVASEAQAQPRPLPPGPAGVAMTSAEVAHPAVSSDCAPASCGPCPPDTCPTPCTRHFILERKACPPAPHITVVMPKPEVIFREAPPPAQPSCRELISRAVCPSKPAPAAAPLSAPAAPQVSYSMQPVVTMQPAVTMQPVVSMQAVPVVSGGFAAGVAPGFGLSAFGAPAAGGFSLTGAGLSVGQSQAAGLSDADLRLLRAFAASALASANAASAQGANGKDKSAGGAAAQSLDSGAAGRDLAGDIAKMDQRLEQEIVNVRNDINKLTELLNTTTKDVKAQGEDLKKTKELLDKRIKDLEDKLKKDPNLKKLLEMP